MRKVGWVAPILFTFAIFIQDIGDSSGARAEGRTSPKRSTVGSALAPHWDHNGSLVSLVSQGAKQKFFYDAPRIGLLDAGVKPGTMLFEGQRTGQNFEGTAYQFYRTCKARGFPVTGSTSDDRRQITLKGKAPLLDFNCNVTGSRDDVLIFTASQIAPGEPTKNTPVAAATGATASVPATNFPSEANRVEASKSTMASAAVSVTAAVAPSEPPKDNSKDKQVAAIPPPESKPAPPTELAKSETAKSEAAKDAKPPVAAQTAANTPAATNTAAPPSEPAKDNQSVAVPGANAGTLKSDGPHPPNNQAERGAAPSPSETPKSTQVAAIPEATGSTAKTDDASKSKNAATAAIVSAPNNLPDKSKSDVSKTDSNKTPALAENRAVPTGPPEKMMEIVLKNGRILRIGRDIELEALSRIISQLER